jgi:hypothetical protein
MGSANRIMNINGPDNPEVNSKLRPIARSTSPIAPTQIHPAEGRGLKTFFEVIIILL